MKLFFITISIIAVTTASGLSQTLISEPEFKQTSIIITSSSTPASLYVGQPFNYYSYLANIYFGIPKQQTIKISIMDFLGKEIILIANGKFQAGMYKAEFDTSLLSAGVYICKISGEEQTEIKKFTVII